MKRFFVAAGALASAVALLAAPELASARTHDYAHHRYHRSYRDDCWRAHHHSANTGTVIGVIGGAVIGSQLAGSGSRTTGALIGAGAGGVLGHHIGAHAHRCR